MRGAGEVPEVATKARGRRRSARLTVRRWAAVLALSEGAVLAVLWAARTAGAWPPALLLAFLVVLSVPIFLFGTWRASLRRAHELRLFRDDGRVRAILGGPLLRAAAWMAVSLVLSLAVFLGAAGPSPPAAVAFLVPPFVIAVFLLADRSLRPELDDPHRRAMALRRPRLPPLFSSLSSSRALPRSRPGYG